MELLFDNNAEATDLTYKNIRAGNNPYAVAAKQLAETLWTKYYPYADKHFLVEIRSNFDARFWEMYLACTLLDNGYNISHSDKGPDIRIDYENTIIWVEAVAPTSGDPNKPDSVPELKMNVVQEVPDRQITLRYSSVIKDKYSKYRKDGIDSDDCYVIALNGCRIPWRHADYEPPRIVRSVLPFGWQEITIDTVSHNVVNQGHQYRTHIRKESGNQVDTSIFLDPEYKHISAVIFSTIDIANPTTVMGSDFILVRNPLALKQLPDDFPKTGWEYRAQVLKNTVTVLSKILTQA